MITHSHNFNISDMKGVSRKVRRVFLLFCAAVLLGGCAAKSQFLYDLPQVSQDMPKGSVVALVSTVDDKRSGDKEIDRIYDCEPLENVQKIIVEEMKSTGIFKNVIGVPKGGQPEQIVSESDADILISPAVIKMDWEVPGYKEMLGKVFAVSILTGGIGGAIYGSTETEVLGETTVHVTLKNIKSGEVLLDKSYSGRYEEKMIRFRCDTPSTKARMVSKSLKAAIDFLKEDLWKVLSPKVE